MRITKLDGLRGVFSLMIVFFHYANFPNFIHHNFFLRESYLSVDFFFVLSGFVITYNYNHICNYTEFVIYIKKRFIRLYPLLIYSTSLYLIYILFANYIIKIYFTSFDIFENSFVVPIYEILISYVNTIILISSTPISGNLIGMNRPAWSISSEMICYVSFGLISIVFSQKRKPYVILFFMFLTVCYSFLIGGYLVNGYGFVRGLICFNVGYYVCFFSQKKFHLNNFLEYFHLILLIIIFYVSFSLEEDSFNKQLFVLITIPPFFGLFIITLIKTDGFLSKLLDTKPIQYLGKISYSIYLNHILFLIIFPKSLFRIFKIPQNNLSEVSVFVITTFSIILYSHFTYKFVELKGGKYLRKILFK